MLRLAVLAAAASAGLALPATASAFTPPELFIRDRTGDSGGPWQPLANAVLAAPGQYALGMRLQPTGKDNFGRQAVFVKLGPVPDGKPDQSEPITAGYCGLRAGFPGEIVSLDRDVDWEGDGAYSVEAVVYDETALPSGGLACAGPGAASVTSWRFDTRPTLQLVGPAKIRPDRRGTPCRCGRCPSSAPTPPSGAARSTPAWRPTARPWGASSPL